MSFRCLWLLGIPAFLVFCSLHGCAEEKKKESSPAPALTPVQVELALTFDLPAAVLSNMSANSANSKTALKTAIATSLTSGSLTVSASQITFTALSYNGTSLRRLTDDGLSDSQAPSRRLSAANDSLEAG